MKCLLAVAAAACNMAWGQVPSYTAAGIVNAPGFTPGPFAPNAVATVFGANLTNSATPATPVESMGGSLPFTLAGTSVYVANMTAPLLYVSATQINFIVPNLLPGTAAVRVVKQNVTGPEMNIAIVPAAPQLFPTEGGYVLAVDWNNGNTVATAATPAHSGDVIVLYATGLGAAGAIETGEVPSASASIANLASLKIRLGDVIVNPNQIQYAGLTPGWGGLYQINLVLPRDIGTDPEITVSIGDQSSSPGLKLAVH